MNLDQFLQLLATILVAAIAIRALRRADTARDEVGELKDGLVKHSRQVWEKIDKLEEG